MHRQPLTTTSRGIKQVHFHFLTARCVRKIVKVAYTNTTEGLRPARTILRMTSDLMLVEAVQVEVALPPTKTRACVHPTCEAGQNHGTALASASDQLYGCVVQHHRLAVVLGFSRKLLRSCKWGEGGWLPCCAGLWASKCHVSLTRSILHAWSTRVRTRVLDALFRIDLCSRC